MATETETDDGLDRQAAHVRSVTVTSVATLAGVGAGLVASTVATTPRDQIGVAVYAAFALGQYGLLYALGVDVGDFSVKDNLYVLFMTFALWFITWGVVLNGTP